MRSNVQELGSYQLHPFDLPCASVWRLLNATRRNSSGLTRCQDTQGDRAHLLMQLCWDRGMISHRCSPLIDERPRQALRTNRSQWTHSNRIDPPRSSPDSGSVWRAGGLRLADSPVESESQYMKRMNKERDVARGMRHSAQLVDHLSQFASVISQIWTRPSLYIVLRRDRDGPRCDR